MRNNDKILVFGAGAVGSILGWRLAQGGSHVSVVCRSNYDRVLHHGFTFRTRLWGNGAFAPHKVFHADTFKADSIDCYDYVILANKIKSKDDTERMTEALRAVVRRQTVLVSTQNGVGHEAALHSAFADNTIMSSVCNMSCSQPRAGIVEQTAAIAPYAFHLGVYDNGAAFAPRNVQKLESLVAMDAQFCAVADVRGEKWRKLVFNAAWNSMTAIAGVDTHELLRCASSTAAVRRLAEEALCIGIASGVDLAESSPDEVIELARRSRPIVTSGLRDARSGRKVETHSITGYLVAQAVKVGVRAPHISMVDERLKQMNKTLLS